MKKLISLSQFILLGLFLIIIYSCQKEKNDYKIKKNKLSGYVQKGPYINGTSIQMYELNSSLNQTGKIFSTKIINNKGSFEINDVALTSQFIEFSADGYYFNEVVGDISPSELSLDALSDITDISTVNINILTHLERRRVEYLVSNNSSFASAKDTAQKEILSIFGFHLDEMDNSEMLDISLNKVENGILLAISIILQGNRSVGDLTELLANITTDIKQDGKLNDDNIISNLRSTTLLLNLSEIRSNLETRYQNIGISATIPGFEKLINDFLSFTGLKPTATTQAATGITTTSATLNGLVNANDLSTTAAFEYGTTTDYGSTTTTIQGPVTGHTNTAVNAALTELNPGTLYHFRLKSVNSLGTVNGSDLTFITLGQVPTTTTQAATGITMTSATLNGLVNANDLSTTATFEYGTTTDYGSSTTTIQGPVTGHTNTAVNAALTELNPGTLYHFRLKSVNSLGTVNGSDLTFTTLGQVPTATTQAATGITTTSATLNGLVNANDLSTTATFEYGTTTDYGSTTTTIQGPVTGHTNTAVNAALTELNPGTLYHFRLKSVNSLGTVNGSDLTFTTLGQVPTATTQAATGITTTSATLNGLVNANDLSTTATFEYGTTTDYGSTTTTSQGPVTGHTNTAVNATLNELNPGTLYHFRLKSVNSLGTVNGSDLTFTTLGQVPTAITQTVTNVQLTKATINGTVGANYLSTNISFEYGLTLGYGSTALATPSMITGNTIATVNANLTGLVEGTVYHFRIVATNSLGTINGNDMTFTTLNPITDIEGNSYKIVSIGKQVWMAENLKTTKYNDGTVIPNITDNSSWAANTAGAYCDYANDPIKSITYGKLYNGYVFASTNTKKICPTGWHMATDAEWHILALSVDPGAQLILGGESSIAGGKLKETGIIHWTSPNTGATNETDFTALPGGYRVGSGEFYVGGFFGFHGVWWTDTAEWFRGMYSNSGVLARDHVFSKNYGLSVRCIKD